MGNKWEKWGKEEVDVTLFMYKNNESYKDISNVLKTRTPEAIQSFLSRRGYSKTKLRKESSLTKSNKNLSDLVNYTAYKFNCKPEEILSKSRKGYLPICRKICHSIAYDYSRNTLSEIGNLIGGVEHDMVLYSKKTLKNILDTDIVIKNKYENILNYFIENKKNIIFEMNENNLDNIIESFRLKLPHEEDRLIFDLIIEKYENRRIFKK